MLKNKLLKIKKWLSSFKNVQIKEKTGNDNQKGFVRIPISSEKTNPFELPVHFLSSKNYGKISTSILRALGGEDNIESYREIPNSRRIRLTLVNPSLIDNNLLEEIDIPLFIRIGKRIIHIIP